MKSTLTYMEKRERFWAGQFTFVIPTECYSAWTSQDWLRHIDKTGGWNV